MKQTDPCAQRPESELEAVRVAFAELRNVEQKDAKAWEASDHARVKSLDSGAADRRQHANHCGWTSLFHVGLLREFACGEVVRQRQGASLELGLMRRFAWYYPAMQDASWTCWGAVVELALRHMARSANVTLSVADCRRIPFFTRGKWFGPRFVAWVIQSQKSQFHFWSRPPSTRVRKQLSRSSALPLERPLLNYTRLLWQQRSRTYRTRTNMSSSFIGEKDLQKLRLCLRNGTRSP